jgi:hypothetical protein
MPGTYAAGMADVDDELRVYRVTVRGRFHDLTDRARRYLVAAQPEHDIFVSAYTPEGTFTYDERIQFFNFRYEVRADGPSATDDATLHGLIETETFLRTMGFGYTGLRASASDLTAMWNS